MIIKNVDLYGLITLSWCERAIIRILEKRSKSFKSLTDYYCDNAIMIYNRYQEHGGKKVINKLTDKQFVNIIDPSELLDIVYYTDRHYPRIMIEFEEDEYRLKKLIPLYYAEKSIKFALQLGLIIFFIVISW